MPPPCSRAAVDQVLDDQRPADRRHQRVAVHVERVALDGRKAVLVGELVAGVDHDRLDRAAVECALTHHLHVLAALTEVDGDRHHLATGLLADPADRDRGVQAAGVRQDDAFGHEVDLLVQCFSGLSVYCRFFEGGGQLGARHRFARHHEDGVIAGDGAHHVGQRRPVDGTRQVVRRAGRGAQHRQVAARVGGHQQLAQQPRHAFGAAGDPAHGAAVLGHDVRRRRRRRRRAA